MKRKMLSTKSSMSLPSTSRKYSAMVRAERATRARAPVGKGTLGRILNVIGEPIDERGPVPHDKTYTFHRDAPAFDEQATAAEIRVTGIKVIDLLAPYRRGGKIGLFGGAGVGKTVLIMELINNCLLYTSDAADEL